MNENILGLWVELLGKVNTSNIKLLADIKHGVVIRVTGDNYYPIVKDGQLVNITVVNQNDIHLVTPEVLTQYTPVTMELVTPKWDEDDYKIIFTEQKEKQNERYVW